MSVYTYHSMNQALASVRFASWVFLFLFILLNCSFSFGQGTRIDSKLQFQKESSDCIIQVKLSNAPTDGFIQLYLFDSPDNFAGLRVTHSFKRIPADGRKVYELRVPNGGEFALLVHHDEDSNGKLNRNVLGIPVEPVAFSNDYQPLGPPSYSRASFKIAPGESRSFSVDLVRPLGEWGKFSVGIGMIANSSPYRDYDSANIRVIPAISYVGERVQLRGPNLNIGVISMDRFKLSATGRVRFGAYEDGKSDFLEGLGDREDTLMLGLAVSYDLPENFKIELAYDHDVLDRIRGGAARLSLRRPFQFGSASVAPKIGLLWQDSDLSNYDFGVPQNRAIMGRPRYKLGDTLSIEVGLQSFVELTENWGLIVIAGVQFLDQDIRESPIVDDDEVYKSFITLHYSF